MLASEAIAQDGLRILDASDALGSVDVSNAFGIAVASEACGVDSFIRKHSKEALGIRAHLMEKFDILDASEAFAF